MVVVGFLAAIGWTTLRTLRNLVRDGRAGRLPDVQRLAALDLRSLRDWRSLPPALEEAFAPRVDGRDIYVRRFARFKLETLGVSPRPSVWLGRDGWLFFNHEADSSYLAADDPRLARRLSAWARALPEWRAWLAERGIRLLIVVAPDKQSVYDDYLPPLPRKLRAAVPLDHLVCEWRTADPRLDVIDLRPPLRDARAGRAVYYRTDTHWTPAGAIVGYRAAARALPVEPLPDAAFSGDFPTQRTGDLPGQLGFWRAGPETFANRRLNARRARTVPAEPGDVVGRLNYLNTRCWEASDGPRVVMFHDSFGDGFFAELLAEHCTRLLAVPSNHLDPKLIERERPDVVILEIVERLFQGLDPRRPTDPPRRSMVR
jgi:hypothetical protein